MISQKKQILYWVTFLLILPITAQNEKYVNMFLGTSGDHGQMAPGAAVPFGMISVCPDSKPGQHVGYDYAVPSISGISINRISGVGCSGTGCNLSVRPAMPDQPLKIVKETEKAHPGYYETLFSNGVKGEFTATKNMAVERYIFPENTEKILYIDFSASIEKRDVRCSYKIDGNNCINGYIKAPTACARGNYVLWFCIKTEHPFTIVKQDTRTALLRFADNIDKTEIRIAVSPVDQAAADDIAEKWKNKSFSQIHKAAKAQWKEKLNKIQVSGSTDDQKTIFYTSLYRIYLSPMNVTSNDGRYKGTDSKIYQTNGFDYYSSWSMWDAFRSKFPLLLITDPDAMNNICRSLLDIYRTGKKNWATPHESVPTVRTEHSGLMLLDSWKKGIKNIPFHIGYEGMKNEAANDYLLRSPDQKLESSYDFWALGQIAEIVGEKNDAKKYSHTADSLFNDVWTKEFMTVTPDFIKMKGNGLYQGSRWQFRWAAPQFINKMIELVGKEKLNAELTYFFDNNLFNQGNEPDIHTPFIFNLLGNHAKSQQVVRDLLTKEDMIHKYGGNAEYPEPFIGRAFQNKVDGLAPEMDEDDGTMSAWYIFCSMGFYPVVLGTDTYEIVSPLYDKIKIHSGKVAITIRTKGRKSNNDIIKGITVNGKPLNGYTISHDIFKKNSEIIIHY